jgi:hypothetical protein
MRKEIIDKIIELNHIYGEEIFLDKQRFTAFIKDFFPEEIRVINLLLRGMDVGLYQKLSDLSTNEYELFKKNYIHILHNDYLLDKNAAAECIKLWHTIVMRIQGKSQKGHNEVHQEVPKERDKEKLEKKYKEMSEEKHKEMSEEKNIERLSELLRDKMQIRRQNSKVKDNKKMSGKIKIKKEYSYKDIEEICERAHFYYKANPFIRDYKKAFKWYKRAAMLGHIDSMFQVGYMYENGRGVEKDTSKALKWYMRAAQFNHKSAMNNIGYLYENGEGVEKDINRAITWYEKAMMLGDDTAKNNIRRIYNDSYRKLH